MRTRALFIVIITSVLMIQAYLHETIVQLAEDQQDGRGNTMHRETYDGKLSSGVWLHAMRGPRESLEEFAMRCIEMMELGEEAGPPAQVKTDQWVDANGQIHQVSLAWDPAITEQAWCDKFDLLVEKFRRAFPCG